MKQFSDAKVIKKREVGKFVRLKKCYIDRGGGFRWAVGVWPVAMFFVVASCHSEVFRYATRPFVEKSALGVQKMK